MAEIKKTRVKILLIVLVLSLAAGVYLAYVYQDFLVEEVISDGQINYQPEESLSITRTGETEEEEIRLLSDNFPSPPRISPDRSRLTYIAPRQWEGIGSLYIYDYSSDEIITLLEGQDFGDQYTPKNVWWLDDEYLLVLEGYAYGTVTVGGELQVVRASSGEMAELVGFPEEDRMEIMDLKYLEDEEIYLLDIAHFDEEFLEYEVIQAELEKDYIYTVIENEL